MAQDQETATPAHTHRLAALGALVGLLLLVAGLFAPWIIRYRKHPIVVGFTKGATAAAAGAIVGAGAVIGTQVIVDIATALIFIAALLILWRTTVSEPLLVGGAAITGLVASMLR